MTATLLLKRSFFQGRTIEGARKLLLFFNISFLYKLIIGHTIAATGATISAVDCYGFGYLLPTLLAVKMYDRRSAARITRTATQASFIGVMVASALGFLLTLAPDGWLLDNSTASTRGRLEQSSLTVLDRVRGPQDAVIGPGGVVEHGLPRAEFQIPYRNLGLDVRVQEGQGEPGEQPAGSDQAMDSHLGVPFAVRVFMKMTAS